MLRQVQRWWLVPGALLATAAVLVALATGAFSSASPRTAAPNSPPAHTEPESASRAPATPLGTPSGAATQPTPANEPAPARPVPTISRSVLRPGAAADFGPFLKTLPGRVQLALLPLSGGRETILGGDAPAHGWSTTKVAVLVALLRARGAGGLTSSQRDLAALAITESDNQAILDLFDDLESMKGGLTGASDYVQDGLRAAGDDRTMVATAPPPPGAVTTFGQTQWAPGQAVKFFRALALGDLLPSAQTTYVLQLMEHIVPSESWGLGSGGFTVPVAFKGGWGPEPTGSYLVRQSGIIDPGSPQGLVVSIVAHPPGGPASFAVGTEMLTSTARWLHSELEPH